MNIQRHNRYFANLNLAQTWINMVLYYRQVYPHECFREKTVFGHRVMVANKGPLEKYIQSFIRNLDNYQAKVKQITIKINNDKNQTIQRVSLNIDQFAPEPEWILSDLTVNKFIRDVEQQLTNYSTQCGYKTFKLGITLDQSDLGKKKTKALRNNWVLKKDKFSDEYEQMMEYNRISVCTLNLQSTQIISTFLP